MKVENFIVYPLDSGINWQHLKSRNVRMNHLNHCPMFRKRPNCWRRNQERNQPRNQSAYTLFLVNLPYYINKAIIIHVFYSPWHQYCIIWVMVMLRNTSSGVRKSLFWKFKIEEKFNSTVISFWDITKKKTKKDTIIVLRNGIHPRYIIYFVMYLIIQLCFCY